MFKSCRLPSESRNTENKCAISIFKEISVFLWPDRVTFVPLFWRVDTWCALIFIYCWCRGISWIHLTNKNFEKKFPEEAEKSFQNGPKKDDSRSPWVNHIKDSQITDFVPLFRPEGVRCDQMFHAHNVWLNMLNILKQTNVEKIVSMLLLFELEKAPKNRLFRVTMS